MLSTTFLVHYNNTQKMNMQKMNMQKVGDNTNPYVNFNQNTLVPIIGKTFAEIFMILFLFDIILITIAIIFTIKLKLKSAYTIFLIVLFLIPGIGFIAQLFVIFYFIFFRPKQHLQ